jgi:hypothetical protein
MLDLCRPMAAVLLVALACPAYANTGRVDFTVGPAFADGLVVPGPLTSAQLTGNFLARTLGVTLSATAGFFAGATATHAGVSYDFGNTSEGSSLVGAAALRR